MSPDHSVHGSDKRIVCGGRYVGLVNPTSCDETVSLNRGLRADGSRMLLAPV